MRKVYVTQYALTRGIIEATIDEEWTARVNARVGDSGYVDVLWPGGMNGRAVFSGTEWSPTLEEAQASVREMVAVKLKSLEKQRVRLEKLAKDGAKVVPVE